MKDAGEVREFIDLGYFIQIIFELLDKVFKVLIGVIIQFNMFFLLGLGFDMAASYFKYCKMITG